MRKAQSPPEGYENVFGQIDELFDEIEKYNDLIDKLNKEEIEIKTEIPDLEKTISRQKENLKELEEEECEKIYGTVHKLLDNNGFGGRPRYIVTVDYEDAILNTFSTFSRAGRFSLPAKLLTKKIALTDGNGFTQYWPQYLQIDDCEWDRMREIESRLKQHQSKLSYDKKRLVEIAAEEKKYSHDMKEIFENILSRSNLLFSDNNTPSPKGVQLRALSSGALTDRVNLLAGKKIWDAQCSICHLNDGGGSVGPNMTDDYWIHGSDMESLSKTIKEGVPAKGMVPWGATLTEEQITQVASFIKEKLVGSTPASPKVPQGSLY